MSVQVLHVNSRFSVELWSGVAGGRSHEHTIVRKRDAVSVIAVEDGHVWLVRQFRPTLGAQCLELPGGAVEGSEAPADAAMRELEEEVGIRAHAVRPLFEFWPLPSVTTERVYAFIATELEYLAACPDTTETDMLSVRIPIDKLESYLYKEVVSAADILILQWLLLEERTNRTSQVGRK